MIGSMAPTEQPGSRASPETETTDDEHGQRNDWLAIAYEHRTKQLREARGALAELVSSLMDELAHQREESSELRHQRDRAMHETEAERERAEARAAEIHDLRRHMSALTAELEATRASAAALRSMKVVRWTAWARRIVYHLRDWRR